MARRLRLQSALTESGKSHADIVGEAKGVGWKIDVARLVRQQAGAPHRWIAQVLNMGSPASVRVYLSRGN